MNYPTRQEKGRIFVVQYIFSKDEMKHMTGTTWIGSGNAPVNVTSVDVNTDKTRNTVWVDIN